MPPGQGRVNRGPAAAADNRRAILTAARRLFAERGFHVPLSVVAKEARIGQGVMYRHFPTRFDLAFAVFEDHFEDLETAASATGPDAFHRLWAMLVEFTVDDAAFVEMVVDARRNAPDYDGDRRLRALVDRALATSHAAATVDPALTSDTVLLAWRMCFGVVVTAPEPDADVVHARVREARALLPADFR
ncbi:TetR/AcrR family transcriptional regulator [Cellulomonas biazotea]|uniref:TetR family transcriptional regulator n=1 Tax=Cellulomonas biazotea TaxID=1709 RepID=A0A402DVB2_9CELL|nr:TetR/AcrR family transcriptional regulator [Cellulomonas biazotea]GCE78064.1 TetR family transcriptional regulator [Cellulomonas biazotea]